MRNQVTLFSAAVALCRERFAVIAGVLLVGFMPSMLMQVLGAVSAEPGSNLFWLDMVVYAAASALLTIALFSVLQQKNHDVWSAYRMAFQYFWRYAGLTIVSTAIIVFGFLLFVIPGIVLGVSLMFATQILIFENKSVMESLRRSRAYVRNRWWLIFGKILPVIIGVGFVDIVLTFVFPDPGTPSAFIVFSVWSFIATSVGTAYWYELYKDARATAVLE